MGIQKPARRSRLARQPFTRIVDLRRDSRIGVEPNYGSVSVVLDYLVRRSRAVNELAAVPG